MGFPPQMSLEFLTLPLEVHQDQQPTDTDVHTILFTWSAVLGIKSPREKKKKKPKLTPFERVLAMRPHL